MCNNKLENLKQLMKMKGVTIEDVEKRGTYPLKFINQIKKEQKEVDNK